MSSPTHVADSAPQPGSCRKPPSALYVESGEGTATLPSSPAVDQRPLSGRHADGPKRSGGLGLAAAGSGGGGALRDRSSDPGRFDVIVLQGMVRIRPTAAQAILRKFLSSAGVLFARAAFDVGGCQPEANGGKLWRSEI